MKCILCNRDDWVGEEYYPVRGHPNLEQKFLICICGNEQEYLPGVIDEEVEE
jgi:hypothetical protein